MDDLTDAEWKWVAALLRDPDAPSAVALRGYLNDRITERLVYERERIRGPVAQRFLDAGPGTGVSIDPGLTLAVGTAIRGTLKWVLNVIDGEKA